MQFVNFEIDYSVTMAHDDNCIQQRPTESDAANRLNPMLFCKYFAPCKG